MAGLGGIPAGYVPSAPAKIQLPTPKQIEEPVQLSAEQQKVLDAVAAGDNVIVEASVGSGKTATIQQLCSIQPKGTDVLYLTYSRLLKQEAQARVRGAKVQNYHGIVYPHLLKHGLKCGISESIRVFNDNFERIAPDVPVYDLLVIDEYQDINEQYAQLIRNIVSRNPTMQIVMVGDPDQKVQSNSVINTQDFAREITASTGRETQQLLFTQSFRMGAEMGELLSAGWNKTVKGMNHTQKLTEMVPGEVVEYLAQFDPGDILCLGQRRGSMTGVLNQLEKRYPEKFNKYSVYAAVRERDEQGSFDDDTAVFTTFDASKGMERKVCVVFDYHEKYWGIRAGFPDVDYEVLRNIFLVAASRGKEEIVFVRTGDYPEFDLDALRDEEDDGPVDCSDVDDISDDTDDSAPEEEPEYIGGVNLKVLQDLPDMLTPRYEKAVSVTECFNFKYAEDVEACMRHIRRTRLDDGESEVIDIQRSDGLIDLSAPVGFYQEMVFFEGYDPSKEMVSVMREIGWSKGDYMDKLDENDPWYNARFLSWLETGQDRYLSQVKKKISDADTAALMKRLSTRLRRNAEHQITVTGDYEIMGRHPGKGHPISTSLSLVGEMDAIDDHGEVYELKFTSALTEPMFLQLATYLVLSGHGSGVLWNTRTDERWRVSVPDRDAYMDAVVTCMSKRWYTWAERAEGAG